MTTSRANPEARQALELNLRHLHVFSSVAAAGSIASAAEGLYRVASAVTRSIAELERSLGRPLFDRMPRGMALNTYGQLALARAQRIESIFAEARAQLLNRGGVAASADVRHCLAAILNGRRLAVIASLADQRNMQAVAQSYGLTQPGVSTALRELERGLGVNLFERRARGLVPTVAGEILAFHFKQVLAELRHIGPDIAASEGELRGSVRVGALPLGRTMILPKAIAALAGRYPALHVETIEGPYDVLCASLRSGEIDFILGALRETVDVPDLQQDALFVDELSVLARAGHPLAGRRAAGLTRLRDHAWVLSRHGTPSRELFERAFLAARQDAPVPAVETSDLAVLRGLLLESDMLTAISAHQLHYEVRDGSLVVLTPLAGTRRHIGVTQRRAALPAPGASALMQAIREVVGRGNAGFALPASSA